ncbi:MAG TPA: hypothetical protein VF593_03840 [Chthoniobacteraceae bacterium]|jgi:hypothetical protein
MGYPTELRNGAKVDSQRIKTFYDSWLKPLYNQDPNLAALLYLFAKDEGYELEPDKLRWFIDSGFLDANGVLDGDFRNVIVSALSIDPEESTLSIERPELPR